MRKTKAPRWLIQLRRRHAQIQQNAVEAFRLHLITQGLKIDRMELKARVSVSELTGGFGRLGVLIKTNQCAFGRQRIENTGAVPAPAKSAI